MTLIDPVANATFVRSPLSRLRLLGVLIARRKILVARKAARRHDWSAAASAYVDALRFDPRRGSAWVQLGNALGQSGAVEPARRAYENATIADPLNPLGHKHLGISLFGGRLDGEADLFLARALFLSPGDGEVRRMLLEKHGEGGVEALLARAALALASSVPKPGRIGVRGILIRRQARRAARAIEWRAAEARYRKFLQLRPADVSAHIQLGHALNEQGRIAEAEFSYRDAVRTNPLSADAWLYLGYSLHGQGRSDAAHEAVVMATRLAPAISRQHAIAADVRDVVNAPSSGQSHLAATGIAIPFAVWPEGLTRQEEAVFGSLVAHFRGER